MTPTLPTIQYGHIEPVTVHFDDLDAMGIVHNARYAVLLERGLSGYWGVRGHTFRDGRPSTSDMFHAVREYTISYLAPIRGTGEILVHFWLNRFGASSGEYGFRFLSTSAASGRETVHAEGRRVVIKLDPVTLRPSPWTDRARETAGLLIRPT